MSVGAFDAAREGLIFLALIAGAAVDIKKREVFIPSLFLVLAAGAVTFNLSFLVQSAVTLLCVCIAIKVKKEDIGFGGGDIWIIVTLTFAMGIVRVLLALIAGLFVLIVKNKIKFKRTYTKKEVALIPYILLGYTVTLPVLLIIFVYSQDFKF
jgi:hypothetical protein